MPGLRHEALFYEGIAGFLEGVVPFVREGVAAGEPVLVVVAAEKLARLHEALGEDAAHVLFADMAQVGANPARIIPAWHAFLAEHAVDGRPVRGVGEPIDAGRRASELTECHRHEGLLNLAFADRPGFWLLCPYDTAALPEDVVHEAARTHPLVARGTHRHASEAYGGPAAFAAPFDEPLPRPAGAFEALAFDVRMIGELRRFIATHAAAAGLSEERSRDLVLALSEIASNSIRHGGGTGVLRVWTEAEMLIAEVRDRGSITDPLAGRVEPVALQTEGRGLWLANQLCDLVQVRAFADGGVVRVHMRC